MRSRTTALAVATLLAIGAWVAPAQASAQPARVGVSASPAGAAAEGVPGGFASWEELLAMQARLLKAADAITAAARGAEGLAGISAKPERRALWVYWKGAVPPGVLEVIQTQRASVPVQILPARFSKKELLRAARVVAGQPGVTSVGPRADGSGLSVSTAASGAVSLAALGALPEVRGLGVPLKASARRPALASRQNSAAPHYGGAKYTFPVGGGTGMCTTGFAIWQTRAKRMLTAGHCGANGDTVYSGSGAVMGTVLGDNNTKDTMLINTSSGGRVYADAYNSNTSKQINSAIGSYEDTLVCTSGAMTGEHCKIRITATDLTINVGYLVFPVVEASHDDQLVAAGKGDSGGPVLAQDSWGPFGAGDFVIAYAVGTITAIDLNTEVPCGSSYAPTQCAYTMFYVDIMDSLAYYNATIATT